MTVDGSSLIRNRRETGFLALLLIAGAILHLLHFSEARQNPFFENPVLDEAIHYEWAASVAAGGTWQPDEPFFRAPLYPLLLALLFKLGGIGFVFPRLVQIAIAVWNPVLLYLLARELFGRNVAATAATALAAYGMLLYFDISLLIVAILLPLDLLSLYLLVRAAKRGGRGAAWLAAGITLGLSATARPNILLFAVAIPFWIASLPRTPTATIRSRVLPFLLGLILPITPVFLHNLQAGEPVLISWQGGTNFYIGNNPESDGMTAIAPGTDGTWWEGYNDLIRLAEEAEGRPLKKREVSRYWFEQGARFIVDQPVPAARLFLKKAYVLIADFEVSNNQGIYFLQQYSRTLRWTTLFGFGLLFPLAVAGMALTRWDRVKLLLAIFLCTYSASIVLFFVTARYRLPLVPILLIFAAIALRRWGEWVRRRKAPAGAIMSIALFLPAILLSNANFLHLEKDKFTQSYFNVGVVHLTNHRYEDAAAWFERAVEEEPDYENALYNLGLCYSYTGRLEDARITLNKLIRKSPGFPEAREALGSVHARLGEGELAILEYGEAIRLQPDFAAAYLSRGMALYDAGRLDDGVGDMESGIRLLVRQGAGEEVSGWIERYASGGVAKVVLERLYTLARREERGPR